MSNKTRGLTKFEVNIVENGCDLQNFTCSSAFIHVSFGAIQRVVDVIEPLVPFQVRTRQWACNYGRVTCNCGVAIRDHNDLIRFSCCNPSKMRQDKSTPISVEIPGAKCLAPGISLTQLIKGFNSKYEVCALIILHYVDHILTLILRYTVYKG